MRLIHTSLSVMCGIPHCNVSNMQAHATKWILWGHWEDRCKKNNTLRRSPSVKRTPHTWVKWNLDRLPQIWGLPGQRQPSRLHLTMGTLFLACLLTGMIYGGMTSQTWGDSWLGLLTGSRSEHPHRASETQGATALVRLTLRQHKT